MVSIGAWPFLFGPVMRGLDRMCAEIVPCDSDWLFKDSMVCVREVGRGTRCRIGALASSRHDFSRCYE